MICPVRGQCRQYPRHSRVMGVRLASYPASFTTLQSTTTPTQAKPTLTLSQVPPTTVTRVQSTVTPARTQAPTPTATPTPFRTQGLDLDDHYGSI